MAIDTDEKIMEFVKVGILTVSDRCSSGEANDNSGPTIDASIKGGMLGHGYEVVQKKCVPDDVISIKDTLISWCDNHQLDLILTTGGTGVATRDVTPEATKNVIDKEVPGIPMAIITESLKITPMAMLSRLVCGIRKGTLIVNFPGSVNACCTSLDVIRPVIKHALHLIKNQTDKVEKVHAMPKQRSKVNKEFVAKRDRKSPYSLITAQEAQKIILNEVKPLPNSLVSSKTAFGCSLSADILAPENYPPVPASIKDGYAVIAADGAGVRTVTKAFVAGDDSAGFKLKPGQCTRITTGAAVPDGADAVVQVEDTILVADAHDGRTEIEIEILRPPVVGQDIRPVGSDIKINSLLVKAGNALTPFDLALLASAGVNHVPVIRKPVVAVMSTGNELQEPEQPLRPGRIRDSNKIMLIKLLETKGFVTVDGGIALDEPDEILSKVNHGLFAADVLISTGGVSMGEKDLLTDVLLEDCAARLHFGRIKMKPGKPTKFFTVPVAEKTKYVFALPGNPVSAAVTFHLFVLPALRRMSGIKPALPKLLKVKIDKEIRLDERAEFARASLYWDNAGVTHAALAENQVSSRLLSMVDGECLLHLPAAGEDKVVLPAGSIVDAQFI